MGLSRTNPDGRSGRFATGSASSSVKDANLVLLPLKVMFMLVQTSLTFLIGYSNVSKLYKA
jgi:hypothetical protein